MKYLPLVVLVVFFCHIMFVDAQTSTDGIKSVDSEQEWIQSILNEHDKPIDCKDYLFYCAGHHGIIWSLIASDSAGIHFYNGTTRKYIESADYALLDSLSFIDDNIATIEWGFDSLASAAKLLKPLRNKVYNPIYNQLYVIKDNAVIFSHNDTDDYYVGPDSIVFNQNISKLVYLMFWLATPSGRQYMPMPSDILCPEK